MKYLLLVLFLAFLSLAASLVPLTPGEMVQTCSIDDACTNGYLRSHPGSVSEEQKRAVFAAYKISNLQKHLYEIRHLIPHEACGSDGARNLFPMRYDLDVKKTELDNRVKALLCQKKLSLKDVPVQFTGDWGQK